MATLELRDVHKSYGKTAVIHGVSLDVAEGEFIVLLGPSGCGKSTLLRMIAGLETVTGGEIAIAGSVVDGVEPMDRNIAMVFQNYALYPHMNVFDNMAYGLKIRGIARAEIEQRVGQAAAILQLEPYLRRKPRELSGGQRQRVAMGRAIVRKPNLFLFDEPLSNLDAKLRVQMRLEIRRLQRELGVTSIYVTHDQIEAMTMADRMVVMNAGVAEQIGAPLEVYDHPMSEFVAGFIGSPATNFLAPRHFGAAAGEAARIGIRPEHLALDAGSGEEAGDGALSGVVADVEALGAETLVHLAIEGEEGWLTIRQDAGAPLLERGRTARARWKATDLMRFDAGGARI